MANVAQIRRINYNGEDIGMGFNSDTGLGVGVALDFNLPPGDVSQEAESDVTIVTSHEELMSTLHMSAQLEGRYAFSSAGGKVDFAAKTQYNSTSTFVVARMVICNTVTRGKAFKLKPDLQHLLDTNQMDVFKRAFGDSFVRAHYNGGEFYAVMRVTSVDSKTESSLAMKLHAAVQGLVAAADFQASLDRANSNEKTRSEFSVRFYQKGGLGQQEIGTTLDVAAIRKRLEDFPDAVKNHPFPYYIEVATYDTIPLPLPGKEQQEDFLLALADADAKKLKYLQSRNDCELAAEHPEYFSDAPSRAVLLSMAAAYTQLVNAAIAHALAISNGQIAPRLFDPSRLTPPIAEPDLVLRKRDVGLEGSFADWWVTKDEAATRKNDRDLVVDIGFAALAELNDFGTIADPGGDPAKTARLQGAALSRVVASFREYDWDHAGMHSASRGPLSSLSALPTMLPLTIKSLAFAQNAIRDARGLEQFTALVKLDLSHNVVGSIAELGALTALRNLQLVDNAISDLGPLRNCASLETLDISGNDIADLTPLASCKSLKNLILAGTTLFKNGVASRSGNPISNVLPLGQVPGMANPFTIGSVLSVRFGVLADGPAAQFTGTATRSGNSNAFRVHLTRGNEVLDDVWTLRSISAVKPKDAEDMAMFFPGVLPSDIPLSGSSLNILRASLHQPFDLNLSYVDPADPRKAGVDLAAYPAFGTKIKLPTFDAAIIS